MYSEQKASCKAIKDLANKEKATQNTFYDKGWKKNVPWIYYDEDSAATIENPSRVNARMSLASGKYLTFKLAKYNLTGSFLGYEDLETQLTLCTSNIQDARKFRRFGTTTNQECNYDLSKLVSTNSLKPNNVNIFYELFLVDSNGNLIDVPIMI